MVFPRALFCVLVPAFVLPVIATADSGNVVPTSKSATPFVSGSTAMPPTVLIDIEDEGPENTQPPTKVNLESGSMAADRRTIETIQRKLQQTIIAKVDFRDVTVQEAVEFLNRETGVPMVVLSLPGQPVEAAKAHELPLPAHIVKPADARITFSLQNVPATEVLRYVTSLAGIVPRIEPGAVILKPLMISLQMIESEDFHVPLAVFGKIATKESPKEFFESKGVFFPPGSTIDYNTSKECLTVRNTERSLTLIEDILEELLRQPGAKQTTKAERELTRELRKTQEWKQTLEKRMVRRVEIHDASMEEIVRELRLQVIPWVGAQVDPKARISLSMKKASVTELLRRIADLTKTQAVIGLRSIVFVPAAVADQ